jgi:hypothetical protein
MEKHRTTPNKGGRVIKGGRKEEEKKYIKLQSVSLMPWF